MTITTYYCDRCGADLAGLKASEVPCLTFKSNGGTGKIELCPECSGAFLELLNDFMKEGAT